MGSPRGQFAYGKVDPKQAGKVAGQRSGISRRMKAALLQLKEGSIFEQIASARELWQLVLDRACALADQGDPRLLLQMLRDATDRVRGKPTRTQLVALDHRATLTPEDIEDAQAVVRELRAMRGYST